MLVGVSDAFVILFLELVFVGVRVRVAPPPESLYELLALFIRFQLFEGFPLFIRDDVGDILFQPFFVGFS
jgi:hypothetical protein